MESKARTDQALHLGLLYVRPRHLNHLWLFSQDIIRESEVARSWTCTFWGCQSHRLCFTDYKTVHAPLLKRVFKVYFIYLKGRRIQRQGGMVEEILYLLVHSQNGQESVNPSRQGPKHFVAFLGTWTRRSIRNRATRTGTDTQMWDIGFVSGSVTLCAELPA